MNTNFNISLKTVARTIVYVLIATFALSGCPSPLSYSREPITSPAGTDPGSSSTDTTSTSSPGETVSVVSYTVTFDSQAADTAATPATMVVTTPATTIDALPSEPVKQDWNFAGWFTEPQGAGTQFDQSTVVSADMTVYAKWSSTPVYKVRFLDGADSYAERMITSPETTVAVLPNDPSRTGYIFGGWWTQQNGAGTQFRADTPVTQDVDVYAFWDTYSYVVTYDGDGATSQASPRTQTVASPETNVGTLPSAPERVGYIFNGWRTERNGAGTSFTGTTAVTQDLTVYAQWVIRYSVSYSLDGGTNSSNNPSTYTSGDQTIALVPPLKQGYTFVGWYTDSGYSQQITEIAAGSSGNLTLYAKWLQTFTVAFDDQGATTPAGFASSVVVAPETTVGVLPRDPEKVGYSFGGWRTGTNGGGSSFTGSTTVSGNLTVYAYWIADSYSITYNMNGGSNSPSNPSSYTYATATITLAAPSRSGYSFIGWYTDAGFTTGATQIPRGSTGARSYYARWWDNTSTVAAPPAFTPSGGTYSSDQTIQITSVSSGATIYYTLDGSTWNQYFSPISVSGDGTVALINAYATNSSGDSDVSGAEYIIDKKVATPVVSLTSGTYSSDPMVTITCATAGASIYYTLDGSAPSTGSTRYTGPIALDATVTNQLRVIAVKDGLISSSLNAGSYVIDPSRTSTPQISPAGGNFTSTQTVSIDSWTSGATIRYTKNGSDPSETNGTVYSGPFTVSTGTTVKAVAYKSGLSVSTVASASFQFPKLNAPATIVATGQFKKIAVTWTSIPGAVSYNLYWIKDRTVSTSTGTKITNASSGIIFPSLINGAYYSFVVTAVNANGESTPSAVATTQPHN